MTWHPVHFMTPGTWHLTLDLILRASFDSFEHNKNNQKEVHKVARMLASFKPTVVLVEEPPEYNDQLESEYNGYLQNPDTTFETPSEINLLAYELGRLCDVRKIYGIDHKMNYNYRIGSFIKNTVDSTWYNRFYKNSLAFFPEVNVDFDTLGLIDKLKIKNNDHYLDFLISTNADMLTHAGTEKGFEGADEAAKFYQRNLRMYSNLNRIHLTKNDRVFILMGAGHTAFFRDFLKRSPKYKMVNTFDYLK